MYPLRFLLLMHLLLVMSFFVMGSSRQDSHIQGDNEPCFCAFVKEMISEIRPTSRHPVEFMDKGTAKREDKDSRESNSLSWRSSSEILFPTACQHDNL